MAGLYAVVAWLIAQVATVLEAPLNLPEWFDTVIFVFLGIGFPLALVLAWSYELTPDGIKPGRAPGSANPVSLFRHRAIDFAIIAALLGVVAYTFWGGRTQQQAQRGLTAAVAEEPLVAVLPFADLSPTRDQEYLACGIAEEVHTQLAALDGLRLIGRTSAASFEGTGEDLRSIGERLGATHIVGGGVQRDAERVRITAWLSDAATGIELWNRPYDQRISDIFAIQEDIARSVAGALSIALGVEDRDLPGAGTSNLEAYDAYSRGRAADRASRFEEAVLHLERAVQLDENYAAAWARLGIATGSTQWSQQPEQARETRERGRAYVLKALEIDPDLAEAHSYLGSFNWTDDWLGMEEEYEKAISLAPADFTYRGGYGIALGRAGRIRRALELEEAAKAFDPLWVGLARFMSQHYAALGRYADARAEVDRALALGAEPVSMGLLVAMSEGDAVAVRSELRAAIERSPPGIARLLMAVLAMFDSPSDVRVELRRYFEEANWGGPDERVTVASLAGYFGDQGLALMAMTDELRSVRLRMTYLWYPFMSEMRQLPGFKDLVTEMGLVEYWRTYGWTDFCRPMGDDEFACQ